jgi:hypothetical protein
MQHTEEMSYLVKLPQEVLVVLGSFLAAKDFGSVRLTCKHVERALFSYFANRFFRERQFFLHEPSLRGLGHISQHAVFSQTLKHVAISAEHFIDLPRYVTPGAQPPWQSTDTPHLALASALASQQSFLDTGMHGTMLSEAFSRLINLETVSIRDFRADDVFDHGTWLRDKGWEDWHAMKSYGADEANELTGYSLIMSSLHGDIGRWDKYMGRIFAATVAALAKAGAHPSCILVIAKEESSGLDEQALHIPSWLYPQAITLLSGLTMLHIDMKLSKYRRDTGAPGLAPSFYLQVFLCHAPALTWLRIGFQRTSPAVVDQFLLWLAGRTEELPRWDQKCTEPTVFNRLEQFDIGRAHVKLGTLQQVLRRLAPTLKRIKNQRVALSHTTTGITFKVRTWVRLCRFIAAQTSMETLRLLDAEYHLVTVSTPMDVTYDTVVDMIHNKWREQVELDDRFKRYVKEDNEGTEDEEQEDDGNANPTDIRHTHGDDDDDDEERTDPFQRDYEYGLYVKARELDMDFS